MNVKRSYSNRPLTMLASLRQQISSLHPWREFAILCLAAMEISWAALAYRSIPAAGLNVPFSQAFIVLAALLAAALLATWGMNALQWPLNRRRWVFFGLLVISVVIGLRTLLTTHKVVTLADLLSSPFRSWDDISITIPAEFIVILVVITICWRGIELASLHVEPSALLGSFRFGVIVFLAYGILFPIWNLEASLSLYLFLFFGLMGMSAARIYALSRLRGGRLTPFDRRWVLGILFSILALMALTGLALVGVRAYGFDLLTRVMGWAREMIILLVLILVIPPLVLILELLTNVFRWGRATELLAMLSDAVQRLLDTFEKLFGPPIETGGIRVPFLRPLILWGIVIIFILLALAALRLRVWRPRKVGVEQLESVAGEDDLNLRDYLRRLAYSLAERLAVLTGLRHPGRLLAAARIRRVYAALMMLSEKMGSPRPASSTPQEFLGTLNGLFPGLQAELDTITQAYQRVRYGQLPETQNDLQAVNTAWGRISGVGRAKIAHRRGAK